LILSFQILKFNSGSHIEKEVNHHFMRVLRKLWERSVW
jgi:hypothetical protein